MLASIITPLLLILTDIFVITVSTLVAYFSRSKVFPDAFGMETFVAATNYLTLWPLAGILIVLRFVFNLYPGYGLNPADELRRQTLTSGLVFFFAFAGGALFQYSQYYSRTVLLLAGILSIIILPITRALCKEFLSHFDFYGSSMWIIGNSKRTHEFREIFERNPALGLKISGVSQTCPENAFARYCLVIPDNLEIDSFGQFLDHLHRKFTYVWVAPNLLNTASVWVTPRDIGGNLALELRNKLLEPSSKWVKRFFDLFTSLALIALTFPLMLLIYFVVKLSSAGGAIHKQNRVGQSGRPFTIYKFRTMKSGAEQVLAAYLEQHPTAKQEWLTKRKLVRDPRVTRVGRFLRRSSLDELPQLFNILKGEMSFVGPRPIVREELAYYGDNAYLYTQVLPGLTGLMQISGRSNLSYQERVRLDIYYARNWSVWLDIVILAKTVVVVARGSGAY
jgi:exopolysaccharide biosynthesis polyprenyl glycosylphosphotransferase